MKASSLSTRLLGYAWLFALGIALVCAALSTDRRTRLVEEYAWLCDPFGYLQIAQDVRQAAATRSLPDFSIESPHNRLLIDMMKSRGLPLRFWDDMVAPLCHHYFPKADHIGVQYPPGTGFMLALFPEGEALHSLDRVVIGLFVVVGLLMLVIAAVRRTWFAAGFVILALSLGLEMLARIDNASFSINAMFAPLLLSSLCLCAAFGLRAGGTRSAYLVFLFTCLAGILFGFAVLVRLQVAFLIPGVLVLLWPDRLRDWYKSILVAFVSGVLLGGVLPLMMNQSRLTGAWYLSTYGIGNTDPPTLRAFWPNFHFYFDSDKPSQYNWALGVMLISCLALFVWTRRRAAPTGPPKFLLPLNWRRVGLAALTMWLIPTVYFLTHEVTGHHYPIPQTFGAVLLLALAAIRLEGNNRAEKTDVGRLSLALQLIGLVVALAPGVSALALAWSNYVPPSAERRPRQFILPADLADDRAWVWADELSGALWYYARKPAHKINFTSPETRLLVFEFVRGRGEPQYLIADGPDMQRMQVEMVQLGATLEQRGEVDGYPYFLIHWPTNRPEKNAAN